MRARALVHSCQPASLCAHYHTGLSTPLGSGMSGDPSVPSCLHSPHPPSVVFPVCGLDGGAFKGGGVTVIAESSVWFKAKAQ